MKKFTIVLLAAVIALNFSAKAQIQRGNVLVGADLTDISFNLSTPHIFSLGINPKAAWFVEDGLAVGAYLKFGVTTGTGVTTWNYGAGGLARFYSGSGTGTIRHSRWFTEGSLGFGGLDVSNGGGNTNGVNIAFGPGYTYFITQSLGLEALIKYNGLIGFGSTPYQNNLSLNIGFQVYLPGKSTVQKVQGDIK